MKTRLRPPRDAMSMLVLLSRHSWDQPRPPSGWQPVLVGSWASGPTLDHIGSPKWPGVCAPGLPLFGVTAGSVDESAENRHLLDAVLFLCQQNEMRVEEMAGLRVLLIRRGLATEDEIDSVQRIVAQAHPIARQHRRIQRLMDELGSDGIPQ